MALINMEINSECLTRGTAFHVILPENGEGRKNKDGKYPVLWLLHGATDDYTMWQRYSSIERYIRKAGIAAVLPNVDNSFYTNIDAGRYFDFVTDELPKLCQKLFPISADPKDNFVAGMSMGGYGTMKIGFTYPERYAALGIFSSASFIDLGIEMLPGGIRVPLNYVRELVFNTVDLDKAHGTEHDLMLLAKQASESGKPLPKIFAVCGTADGTIKTEKKNIKYLQELDNPYDCLFMESCGFHDFDFWDQWLPVFLQWLPIQA
jgi:S-formylglutathione hydrolase FrmB